LPDIGWQVGKESPDSIECVVLSVNFVVDRSAAARMNVRAAKLFLGNHFADSSLDYRGTSHKKLADALDHYREVRRYYSGGAESRYGSEACPDDRDF
jgi:hypothetical protein